MSGKTLYDVLGVPPNASAEQLRAAYLGRSKVLHPDRFDPERQATEWRLANEMLKELNYAYGVLRDPAKRANYDTQIIGQKRSAPSSSSGPHRPREEKASPPPGPTIKLGKLQSGKANFVSLPRTIQDQLKKRVAGGDPYQVCVKLSGVAGNYLLAALCLCWYWFLYSVANDTQWSSQAWWWIFGVTVVVAVVQGLNLDWICNYHLSPLGQWLLITPLYLIKTHWDKLWFWPLWDVTGLHATHRYTNGSYTGTDLKLP